MRKNDEDWVKKCMEIRVEGRRPAGRPRRTWIDIQHITNILHSVLTGDVNTHSTLWHLFTDDHRGQLITDVISTTDHITLNTNTPHYTTGHRGQLNTHYHLTTYPSSPQSTYDMTIDCNKIDEHLQTTRKPTGHNLPKTRSALSLRPRYPPNIHTISSVYSLSSDRVGLPLHNNPSSGVLMMSIGAESL